MTVAETNVHSDIDALKDTTFRATLVGRQPVDEFKAFAKGAYGLLTELVFDINADGIRLRQLDSSKAAMISAEFKSSFFTEYGLESEGHDEVTICVPSMEFNRVVTKAKDELELAICTMPDGYHKNRKKPRLEIMAVSDLRRSVFLRALTPPENKTKKPSLPIEASLNIMAGTFSKVIGEVHGTKKSHLRFIAQAFLAENSDVGKVLQAGLVLFAADDEGEILYEFPAEDEVIWNLYIRSGKTQNTMYHVSYLNEARKLFHKEDELKVKLSTHKPLVVECNTVEGKEIQFILAPRVERR